MKKLSGGSGDYYRLCVGDYRIGIEVEGEEVVLAAEEYEHLLEELEELEAIRAYDEAKTSSEERVPAEENA